MNIIEFTPAATFDQLRDKLAQEVDSLIVQGWKPQIELGQIRLTMIGRPDKVVRGGVIHG